jgi:hypothetical protein
MEQEQKIPTGWSQAMRDKYVSQTEETPQTDTDRRESGSSLRPTAREIADAIVARTVLGLRGPLSNTN